ncbi:alpha/beta hydrolase [Mycobacterium sp.]|uniref:alpha/beta hydrolase n=1 Tax=Mycobacterium sp. TaxID=1785 RepID=UPI002C613C81|nr:alpha/beta hydrolase [Mycobacterium sp.]HME49515.1 alpha/beta hydrolase [Mycobacterium sp.]
MTDRSLLVIREFGLVLPRAVNALTRSAGWSPASPAGMRQLGEVMLDELVLTGMSVVGGPGVNLTKPLSHYAPAAQELSALGVAAHADPEPLQVSMIRPRRVGRLAYETVTFEHDPRLPRSLAAEGLGGPVTAGAHLCRHRDAGRPWLVWVHGAGQGGPLDLLLSRAGRIHRELGYNIAFPVQPGHGFRRAAWPSYPETEPLANVAGMMRAISEVRALVRWLRPQAANIVVSGVSLGSPVAALVSGLEEVDAVALYTPILGLNAMIARHIHRQGAGAVRAGSVMRSATITALTSVIDPLAVEPSAPADRRLIVGARNDRMAMPDPAIALHRRWGGQLYWYEGSHVGHVFSRRVHAVTEQFLRGLR